MSNKKESDSSSTVAAPPSSPSLSPASSAGGICPVNHTATFSFPWGSDIQSRPLNNVGSQPAALSYQPASIEEAAQHAQTPQPDQSISLGTERQVSSIPRGDNNISIIGNETPMSVPHHQPDTAVESSRWVYPSEQQMYNAMRRKGWTNIPEDSIPTVLNIHNNINERTWKSIQEWEDESDLKLVRFEGRPTQPSPKAFLLCHLLHIYDKPFDRHDWYVENPQFKTQQRYVIDYYYVEDSRHSNVPPRPYIDARPALDQPRAILLRGKQFFKDAFPAISKRLFGPTDSQSIHETVSTGSGSHGK
jgi:cytochrome c heme-lyase